MSSRDIEEGLVGGAVLLDSNNSNTMKSYQNDGAPAPPPTKLARYKSDPLSSVAHNPLVPDRPSLQRHSSYPMKNSVALTDEETGRNPAAASSNRQDNNMFFMFHSVRMWLRSVRRSPSDVVQTFYCGICMENCDVSLRFASSVCTHSHAYCTPCMAGYVHSLVDDGVITVACPGSGECHTMLLEPEFLLLLLPESVEKYNRFKSVKTDAHYRECPHCNHGESHESASPQTPQIVCKNCGSSFCFYHANAHPTMSCQQYIRRLSRKTKKELQASEKLVYTTTLPCPSCGAATEKNGGCNHMTCQHCRANWCWLCSRVLTDVTEHYKANNIFGCPGAQFTDTRSLPRLGCFVHCPQTCGRCNEFFRVTGNLFRLILLITAKLIRLLLILVLAIPIAVIVFALAVASLPFWICGNLYYHGSDWYYWRKNAKNLLFPGAAVVILMLLLLDIAWLPLPLLLLTIVYCGTMITNFSHFREGFESCAKYFSITVNVADAFEGL